MLRLLETSRPPSEQAFGDPFALKFAALCSSDYADLISADAEKYWGSTEVVRTALGDAFLLEQIFNPSIDPQQPKQIVLVGNGFLSRPYRLPYPPRSPVFEIDEEDVVRQRKSILSESHAVLGGCVLKTIAADVLKDDWAAKLIASGFDPCEPAVWLVDGLLDLLPAFEGRQVLETISGMAAEDSVIFADAPPRSLARQICPLMAGALESWGVPMSYPTFSEDKPADYLATLGWLSWAREFGSKQADFGRWDPDLANRNPPLNRWLVFGNKKRLGKYQVLDFERRAEATPVEAETLE